MLSDAFAACSVVSSCPTSGTYITEENAIYSHIDPTHTPAYTRTCYRYSSTQYLRITSVPGSCPSGTTREIKKHTSALCGASYTYYDCKSECTGCSNCTDNATWTAGNTGYEKRTTKTCNYDTCNCETGTAYRCATGYYGSPRSETSGCTRCPRDGDVLLGPYGTTDSAGKKSVISCYIPAGTEFSDGTGDGVYPDQCNYEEDGYELRCAIGDEGFCMSNDDCGMLEICSTSTNCCTVRAISGGDIIVGDGDLVLP